MKKTVDSIPRFFTPDMFPEAKVKAPGSTTRQDVVSFVQNYAMTHCGPDKNNYVPFLTDTWRYLYNRLRNSELRFNPYYRAKTIGSDNKLEAIDTFGYLDELYAIAKRDLK